MKRTGLITLVVILSAFVITPDGYGARNSKAEESHDIAITNISAPSSCVQGDTVHVVVTVKNQGDHSEKLIITLTDNTDSSTIGTQSVSLVSQASAMNNVCDLTFDEGSSSYEFAAGLACCDVDNDNYDDVIIGSSTDTNAKGRAYLYWGGPDMDANYDLLFEGEMVGDKFASVCVTCSDIDNDNYGDIILGARGYPAGANQGRAYLYWGKPRASMTTAADLTFNGETGVAGQFGSIVIRCGDIDKDNYQDILIAAYPYDNSRGRVYLYWGDTKTSMNTGVDLVFQGENDGDQFGFSTGIGDIDNDGYDDIVIGARKYPAGSGYGRAYLYWGKPRGDMTANADLTFDAETQALNYFGKDVAFGDIDNDGYNDLLIGAMGYSERRGRVYLYYGDTKEQFTVAADKTFNGEAGINSEYGHTIVCSDINGDDYDDILIGADVAGTGNVFLYYGDTKGQMNEGCDLTFSGENVGDYFSLGTSSGDVDNDNYSDLIVGAIEYPAGGTDGRAYLYYGGGDSSKDVAFNWDTTGASAGQHTLKAEVVPVSGENDTADNTQTETVNVKLSANKK